MIKLRNFEITDAAALQKEKYHNMSVEEIQDMICKCNKRVYEGKYFEMFAVINENGIVGTISLFQHSDSVISIGPEIFSRFQRKGFGKQALAATMEICKNKGYKIVCQQVLSNNAASIALHRSMNFETDMYCYKNEKGESVYIFLKPLQ